MFDERHVLTQRLTEKYRVFDNIYWNNMPNPEKAVIRHWYNPEKKRLETQEKHGGEWWVIDAEPAQKMTEDYLSILDYGGILNFVLAERVHYAVLTGAGTFRCLSLAGGGMKISTGAANNDDCTIGGGDNTGLTFPWNVDKEIWFFSQFRFSAPADTANVRVIAGLYRDANNYIGVRYDTAIDNVLYMVSRSAGLEEIIPLGAPTPDLWVNVYAHATRNSVKVSIQNQPPIMLTTHIPTVDMAHYAFIRTLSNLAKHLDIRRLIIVQDTVR
jgi:hypothetical protein